VPAGADGRKSLLVPVVERWPHTPHTFTAKRYAAPARHSREEEEPSVSAVAVSDRTLLFRAPRRRAAPRERREDPSTAARRVKSVVRSRKPRAA